VARLRELASDTAVYGLTTVVSRLLTYLLVPFYTRFFGPDEYGVISLVFIGIGFFNVLFTFGMESAYLRYGVDRERANSLFRSLQSVILGVATALVLLLWILAPFIQPVIGLPSSGADPIYVIMLGILWLDALVAVPFAELRLVRRTRAYASAKLINVALNVAFNLILVIEFQMGIIAVMYANLIASGFTLIHTALMTRSSYKGYWDRNLLNQALRFGLPYIPAGIGYILNEGVSRVFLNAMPDAQAAALYGAQYTSADITGIFAACYKLSVFMMLFTQMFRMAWQPFFMRYANDEDAPRIYADVFRYFNAIAAVIFLSIALFAAEIAAIPVPGLRGTIIDSRYWLGLNTVPMLLMAYWFQGWYTNFTAGIFIRERTRILPLITLVGAAITIIANLILVPKFGMMGAAWASVLSYGCMAMLIYTYAQRAWSVPYSMVRSWFIMLCCGGIVGYVMTSPYMNSILYKAIAVLVGILVTALIVFIKPTKAKLSVDA